LKRFNIIAFTHKNIDISNVGEFHLADDIQQERLNSVKSELDLEELMYLSTCNRVEFLFTTKTAVNNAFLKKFFSAFNPSWDDDKLNWAVLNAAIHAGIDAVEHIFNVASSLDSMVVGEREIITQVRKSYDLSKKLGITGHFLNLLQKHTIETAKQVYTETNISKNPVSIVSLAYRKLVDMNVKEDARFLIVGAGVTNRTMTNFLFKHGYKNFAVFNRTFANAEKMATEIHGVAHQLDELKSYTKGFDVIVTCTASEDYIINKEVYEQLLQGDDDRKLVIDLAIPNDFDEVITNDYPLHYVQVTSLRVQAEANIKIRKKELSSCEAIISTRVEEFKNVFKSRQVELAMSEVPKTVKEINRKAIKEVFAKDIELLDDQSKEILDKVLSYVEKKYISVPMKMAREILLEKGA
jgi:glutamyl-tRNA reductase